MTRAEDVLPGPRAVIPPLLQCWRCGEPSDGLIDCFTPIQVKGRTVVVHTAGCVPTIAKETR